MMIIVVKSKTNIIINLGATALNPVRRNICLIIILQSD